MSKKYTVHFTIALLALAFPHANLAQADSYDSNSIWYSSTDPLDTNADAPPPLPNGYRDSDNTTVCLPFNINDANKTFTLGEIVDISLCNNPQTREAYANARIQVAQLGVAKSAYLPTINDSINTSININAPQTFHKNPYTNFTNNIVANYLLYDFGNRNANLEYARQLLQAASASQNSIVQNVLFNTVQAFYQVQAKQAALEANIQSEQASTENFKSAEAQYKAGISTPADKLQAQTAMAQQTLLRITAEGALKSAYGTLANVMGFPANQTIHLTSTNPTMPDTSIDDVNNLIEQARIRRPDLLASEAQLRAAEANISARKSAAKPTISISLGNTTQLGNSLDKSSNTALGVNVNIPIFQGYASTYLIHAAEANAELKSAQLDKMRLQVSLDVWNSYQTLKTAIESISAAQTLLNSAEESARLNLGRYQAGVGNMIDSLNAQSALATARQQFIQAHLNWRIARASLAQAIGILDNAMIQSLPQNQ